MTQVGRPALDERLRGADVALVAAPGLAPEREHACASHLEPADVVLAVAVRPSPNRWLDARRDYALPPTRFVATQDHEDCVRVVGDPGDLTGLGIAVSEFLDDLPADAVPGVCLDSLTTLLQYVEAPRVYRFLQVLCGRVRAQDGVVHCHLDPSAHDADVRDALAGLFDTVAAVDDGDVSVR